MLELNNPQTGEVYANGFRMTEDQRLRSLERISSGEKQEMFEKNNFSGSQAFGIGMKGETIFEDVFPDSFSVKEALKPDLFPHHKKIQFYTDYLLEDPQSNRIFHIDVKTRLFKKCQYKNPASFFQIYVTDKIKKNIEKGFYKTDLYAFFGVHEDEQTGWLFALIPPKVFFEHAEFKKEFWDGSRCISDSWCLPLETAYKLCVANELKLKPNFNFENRNDDESYWFVSKGTEVTVKIFYNQKFHGLKKVTLRDDHKFKSKNIHLEHKGDGQYSILFHTNPPNPEEADYHLIVDRNDVEFKYGA